MRLCWLPLSHIYARTSDYYLWVAAGGELALSESRDTILADLQVFKPHYLNGVPYFFDKVMRGLQEKGLADKPGILAGMLGGRMKLCCAGGAALPDYVAAFFERSGITLVQGYGLTESSPVITTGTLHEHRLGTVGKPIHGVEVKIADDGEILTRGPHVMVGYWNLPEETAKTIEDGWLHTGDLGALEDGFLTITGRKKELIVTLAGKNIAPTFLEGLITEDPLVAQVMIIGDSRNFLTALNRAGTRGPEGRDHQAANPRLYASPGRGASDGRGDVQRADLAAADRRFALRAGAEVHPADARIYDRKRHADADFEGPPQRGGPELCQGN